MTRTTQLPESVIRYFTQRTTPNPEPAAPRALPQSLDFDDLARGLSDVALAVVFARTQNHARYAVLDTAWAIPDVGDRWRALDPGRVPLAAVADFVMRLQALRRARSPSATALRLRRWSGS